MQHFSFPPAATFVDRLGITRPIAQLSILGREYFKELLAALGDRLQGEGDWKDQYDRDRHLQYLIQECLSLCGIEPEWVSLPMVEQMLFEPGWLVQLNFKEAGSRDDDGEGMSAVELIGLLAADTGLDKAIELAKTVPANLLTGAIEAKAEWTNPQKGKIPKSKKGKNPKLDRAKLDELLTSENTQQLPGDLFLRK